MSEITTQVKFTTRIDRMTSRESTRYAINSVRIVPKSDDEVYAVATDSRAAVVVPCEGKSENAQLVPPAMLPHKRHKDGLTVSLNGRWETSEGRFANVEEEERRFPQVSMVIPMVGESHRCLALDIGILANMAEAMGAERVVLFVPEQRTCKTSGMTYVHDAIPVMGMDSLCDGTLPSIGVIMPIAADGAEQSKTWEERRKAFQIAESEALKPQN